jgi:crotonobetainyl-CoA:carnitine CoA-transferase CaiB-like acyl-CoA transferase
VDISLAPVKMGGYFAGYHGGLVAALTGLALFLVKGKNEAGRMVDISLEEVMLALVSPVVAAPRPWGAWKRVTGMSFWGRLTITTFGLSGN